jgi:hypothetical protein
MSNDTSQEVFEISRYLRDHAKSDFKSMPEKTVSAVLNRASGEARLALAKQFKAQEYLAETGGRIDHNGFIAPFAPRIDESTIRSNQPKELNSAIDKLQTEVITTELNQRMGTPTASTADSEPTTLRDVIDASFGD